LNAPRLRQRLIERFEQRHPCIQQRFVIRVEEAQPVNEQPDGGRVGRPETTVLEIEVVNDRGDARE
jgi:hypothetical protein